MARLYPSRHRTAIPDAALYEASRFFEIGSGLSTYWATLALARNADEGAPCKMVAIDPYVRNKVRALPGLEIDDRPVQEVPPEFFSQLESGDVLFIDSTHVVKIDGDVPHLYLEVVPVARASGRGRARS